MDATGKNVVCRVRVGEPAGSVEFTWSEGSASFKPYTLEGEQVADFRANARAARQRLFAVVRLHECPADRRDPAALRRAGLEMAQAGHDLYNQIFDRAARDGDHVDAIAGWLRDLGAAGQVESLEVVCDGQPWFAPWNLVYDEDPDEAAFEAVRPAAFEPFWGMRYNLCGGHPVDPLRRMPLPPSPGVLVVIDPVVIDNLAAYTDAEGVPQRARLERFLAGHGLEPVTTSAGLAAALRRRRPHLLYWLGHAHPDALYLGAERIDQTALRNLLRNMKRVPGQVGGLVFLNACRTAEPGDLGSFLKTFHAAEFSGLIATEEQTLDSFANPLGLGFLERFLTPGATIGRVLHDLRRGLGPMGLLYGCYCPPDLHIRAETDRLALAPLDRGGAHAGAGGWMLGAPPTAARPAEAPPRPLPEHPYLPLGSYDEEHRALFAGRDDDVARFAMILDRPETRLMVLHGESGVGKSSFLRAGLIPFLEDECVGYRVLRDRTAGGDASTESPVIFVRATDDAASQLAQALTRFAARPLCYTTPQGRPVEVDLAGVLGEAVGKAGLPPPASLAERLLDDPGLLARVLGGLARVLPATPVLVIDQAEEIFTLARTDHELRRRDRVLEMLCRVADGPAPFKLIVSLRTEYYGRLVSALRRGLSAPQGVREYLLTDLDREGLVAAVLRPTLAEPVRHADRIPFDVYGFRYADGVAEAVASELIQAGRRDGVLPLAQFLCDQLYQRARGREDATVTMADFDAIGRLGGGLRRYLEQQLERLAPGKPSDRDAFKQVLARLTHRQADGTLTTELLREDLVARSWQGSTPFAEIVECAEGLRLVRVSTRRLGDGREERSLSLGHDALARVGDAWREEAARRARVRRMTAVTALASLVAACMAVLAFVAWAEMRTADRLYREARASERRLRLQASIRDALDRFDGDDEGLRRIDGWIAELGRLDPSEVPAQKQLLNARLVRAIQVETDRSLLNVRVPDVARIEQRAARLVDDAPRMAPAVRRELHWLRRCLLSAYRGLGREDEALRIAESLLAEPLIPQDRIEVTSDYCWIKILAGRPADGLSKFDGYLKMGSEAYDPALMPLLTERARVYAALSQYDRAEQDVDRFLKEFPTDRFPYYVYADACLLRGVLWHIRGEPAKGLDLWRKGLYRTWPYRWSQDLLSVNPLDGRAVDTRNYLSYFLVIMGAATGEVSEADAGFAFQLHLGLGGGGFAFGPNAPASRLEFLTTSFQVEVMNDCLRTPRGRDFLRRLAFHQLGYYDRVGEPFALGVLSAIRLSAMRDGIPDDVEPLIWDAVKTGGEQLRTRRMSTMQLFQLMSAYAGNAGWLGWNGVSRSLDPALIPAIAFVLGHRYLVLGSPREARRFFLSVIGHTPVGSPLRSRASQAVERIEQGPAR